MEREPLHQHPPAPETFRAAQAPGRWEGVDTLAYKEEGAVPFRAISRQVLFADPALACELRYFEVAAGGYSTLERHEHVHAVMVHTGKGQCLVGDVVRDIGVGDLVHIPAMTWHQFRANKAAPLGFLCMVNAVRDKPQLPTEAELATLRKTPALARFLDDTLIPAMAAPS